MTERTTLSAHGALIAATLALALAACSAPAPDPVPSDSASGDPAPAPSAPASPSAAPSPGASAADGKVLGLDGLGPLKFGQPVPAGSGWTAAGAQASDTCLIYTAKAWPGVYAIVEGGAVRRITLGQRSTVTLAEGIGVGASEAAVKAAFGGFRETPHKYVGPPAKYLDAPNAESGDPALRFEIGEDRRVSLIHIGTAPVLGYVEGCA